MGFGEEGAGRLGVFARGVAVRVTAVFGAAPEEAAEHADGTMASMTMVAAAATTAADPRARTPLPWHFTTDELTPAIGPVKDHPHPRRGPADPETSAMVPGCAAGPQANDGAKSRLGLRSSSGIR